MKSAQLLTIAASRRHRDDGVGFSGQGGGHIAFHEGRARSRREMQ
jgi:hypothetical protein